MNKSKLKRMKIGLALLVLAICILFRQSTTNRQTVSKPNLEPEAQEIPATRSTTPLPALANLNANIESHRQMQKKKEDKTKAEEAEALRRQRWKENFPYQPTHHPTLTYDPTRYDPGNPSTFHGDPEMETAVKNHGFLVAFYNNPNIYSSEFEQLYHMLEEVDRADNPIMTGRIFNMLIHYYKSQRFAPTDLWSRPGLVQNDTMNESSQGMTEARVPIDGKTTWGDKMEGYRDSIVGLLALKKCWPNKEEMSAETAKTIRDRFLDEIPSENLFEMRDVVELPNGQIGAFGYYDDAEKALKSGDQLLYR